MSSKRKALKEKNIVIKLVKELDKRMTDFETSVEDLKILKETITEMHEEVVNQEIANASILSKLKSDLKENKTRILNDEVESLNKVIISVDELDELKEEVEKFKNMYKMTKNKISEVVEEKVEELLQHRLKLQELEHKAEVGKLSSQVENYQKEILNLNKTFVRMSEELESQKKLTSNLALGSRPIVVSEKSN